MTTHEGIFFLLTALKWGTLLFVVQQNETVLVTRFGKVIRTMAQPGLHMKLPVIDVVRRFDNRILAWEGPPTECPTKDKLYIIVDSFARWRISDPLLYYNRLNDERSALSRLDDILLSETRTAVATHDLVEIVRVTKGRKPVRDRTPPCKARARRASRPLVSRAVFPAMSQPPPSRRRASRTRAR